MRINARMIGYTLTMIGLMGIINIRLAPISLIILGLYLMDYERIDRLLRKIFNKTKEEDKWIEIICERKND